MNESRNRFFITAVAIVVAIAFFRAMSKGRLPGFLLEQGLIFLVAGTVIAAFVLTDRMTRYYKWIFGVIGAAGLIFFGTVFRRAGLEAKREGEFGEFALALLSIAVVIGTIVGMDMFFRKRRSEQWMTGFRIYMALAVVALIVGLGAYLLAGPPK